MAYPGLSLLNKYSFFNESSFHASAWHPYLHSFFTLLQELFKIVLVIELLFSSANTAAIPQHFRQCKDFDPLDP